MAAKADAKIGLVSFDKGTEAHFFSPYNEILHNGINWADTLVGLREKDGGTLSTGIRLGLFDV